MAGKHNLLKRMSKALGNSTRTVPEFLTIWESVSIAQLAAIRSMIWAHLSWAKTHWRKEDTEFNIISKNVIVFIMVGGGGSLIWQRADRLANDRCVVNVIRLVAWFFSIVSNDVTLAVTHAAHRVRQSRPWWEPQYWHLIFLNQPAGGSRQKETVVVVTASQLFDHRHDARLSADECFFPSSMTSCDLEFRHFPSRDHCQHLHSATKWRVSKWIEREKKQRADDVLCNQGYCNRGFWIFAIGKELYFKPNNHPLYKLNNEQW